MPQHARVFSLFLAGARDVVDEQAVVRQLVDAWNREHGARLAAWITVTSWKTNTHPSAGAEPQAIINRQVFDSADIVVGVFWTHFGTPTSSAGSGTEEEIERGISSGKRVMVYFSDRPLAPSTLDSAEYTKVSAFKRNYAKRGLYTEYGDLSEFREYFRTHLALVMNEICRTSDRVPSETASGDAANEAPISISLSPTYWVIVLAAVQRTAQTSLQRVEELRKVGVKLEEISETETTALAAPVLIRAFIIDVLVKHGIIKPEAGEQMGYAALMETVTDVWKNHGKPNEHA